MLSYTWGRMSQHFSHTASQDFVKRQSLAEILYPLLSDLLCAVQNWDIIMFPPRSSFHSDEIASLLTMTNLTAGSKTLLSQRWAVVCLGHLLVILFYGSIFVGKIICIFFKIWFMLLKVTLFCWRKLRATKYHGFFRERSCHIATKSSVCTLWRLHLGHIYDGINICVIRSSQSFFLLRVHSEQQWDWKQWENRKEFFSGWCWRVCETSKHSDRVSSALSQRSAVRQKNYRLFYSTVWSEN